jgi:RNA-directed DNA polymerase
MTTIVGAPLTKYLTWESIPWQNVEYQVQKLQLRIAKAIREGRTRKAKALQWLLTHSFSAKLLAVKRVTENKGKNTPGVDGITWKTPKQKMKAVNNLKRRGYRSLPLRRIHIPKKSGGFRPLGIPTKTDLSQQALHLLALEPVAETLADKNSYGFRPKRSTHDAIGQSFIILAKKRSAQWILEGDIRSCFDRISHTWLENNTVIDKFMLKQWLKAGYIEKDAFYSTHEGSPQGSCISAALANITLDGLENTVKACSQNGIQIHYVRYADDWICTARSKEILIQKVLPAITAFLKERGLELSQEKTKITHIEEGFDFLGFNLRKYGKKLLIKPAKKGIKRFLRNIREVIKKSSTVKTEQLIRILNSKIQGWANHFQHCVAKQTFSYIDCEIFKALWRWAKRRHPKQSASWIKERYFTRLGLKNWCFFSKSSTQKEKKVFLKAASDTPIKRHVKIKGAANPYDPQYNEYFQKRMKRKHSRATTK